jgi:hypothetical protein
VTLHDFVAAGDTRASGALPSSSTRKNRTSTVNSAPLSGRRTGANDGRGSTALSTRKRVRSQDTNGDTDDGKEASEKIPDGVERQRGPQRGASSKGGAKSKIAVMGTGVLDQPKKKVARTEVPTRSNTSAALAGSSMVSDPSEDAAQAVSPRGGASRAATPANQASKGASVKRGKSKGGRSQEAATSSHVGDQDGADGGAVAGPAALRLAGVSAEPVASTEAEQWELLQGQLELLAIAPEDEVLAEILSLQTELAQVCFSPSLVQACFSSYQPGGAESDGRTPQFAASRGSVEPPHSPKWSGCRGSRNCLSQRQRTRCWWKS